MPWVFLSSYLSFIHPVVLHVSALFFYMLSFFCVSPFHFMNSLSFLRSLLCYSPSFCPSFPFILSCLPFSLFPFSSHVLPPYFYSLHLSPILLASLTPSLYSLHPSSLLFPSLLPPCPFPPPPCPFPPPTPLYSPCLCSPDGGAAAGSGRRRQLGI